MSDEDKTRKYTSSQRAERARENREAMLRAAFRLFVADGFHATSLAAIARASGVSNDLVYKVFGTKRRLLMEVLNFVVIQDAESHSLLDQAGPKAIRAENNQHRQLEMLVTDITASTIRARPLDDVFRSAVITDPEIAGLYRRAHGTRLKNLTAAVGWLASTGPLQMTEEQAAASLWTLTGPDSHRQMVDGLGWTEEQWRAWVHNILAAALLTPRPA